MFSLTLKAIECLGVNKETVVLLCSTSDIIHFAIFHILLQLTEEKLGTAEKTELDSHFENLAERAECTKTWTEKILRDTETVLTPNPGNRAEDYIFEKIEKKKPTRLSNLEYMGLDMIEVGLVDCGVEPFGF